MSLFQAGLRSRIGRAAGMALMLLVFCCGQPRAFLGLGKLWSMVSSVSKLWSKKDEIKDKEPGEEIKVGKNKYTVPDYTKYDDDPEARQEVFSRFRGRDGERFAGMCEGNPKHCSKVTAYAELLASDETGTQNLIQRMIISMQVPRKVRRQMYDIGRRYNPALGGNPLMAKNAGAIQIGIDPSDPQGYIDYAHGALGSNEPEEALEVAQRGAARAPESSDMHAMVAKAKMELGDYQGAYDSGMRALGLDPKNGAAHTIAKLASTRLGAGKTAEPGAAAGGGRPPGELAASRTRPAKPATEARKPALASPGRNTGALAAARLVSKGKRFFKQKDYEAADRLGKRALGFNSKSAAAYALRIRALIADKRYDDAMKVANSAIKLFPKGGRFYSMRAAIHNLQGRHPLAHKDASKALLLNSKDAEAYLQRAVAQDGMGGDREAVLQDLATAAALDPRYRALYEKAKSLKDGELAALLGGESLDKKAGAAARSGWFSKNRRLATIGFSVVVGGLLIALGILHAAQVRWKDGLKRAMGRVWQRSPELQNMPAAETWDPGTRRAMTGKYRFIGEIGVGGMGKVFEAEDASLGRRVAVKKMREEIRDAPGERDRFLQEARLVAKMHHDNIVDIYSVLEEGDDIFLVFELVDGKTVHDLLRKRGKFAFDAAVGVVRGMAKALDYAHKRGIVHRDLKLGNVMINKERKVKVMDFGVARLAKDSMTKLEMTRTVVGTPQYMSPEMEQGVVGKPCDIYALGVCLYQMLTGRYPFEGNPVEMLEAKRCQAYVPLSEAAPGLPDGVDEVLAKALDPDPDRRFATAGEFYRSLKAFLPAKT